MENAIEKLGLYDFFGVYIPGAIITVLGIYFKLPILNPKEYIDIDAVVIAIFILEGYVIGIVLQELSSLFDKIFKIRYKARKTFLNNNIIITNSDELKEIKVIANEILGKSVGNNIFTENNCEYVFLKCKTMLELKKMAGKAERINSLFAMSRGLTVSSMLTGFILVYRMICIPSLNYIKYFICICIITFFLYKRTKMYSKYYIRVVFRHYISIKSL